MECNFEISYLLTPRGLTGRGKEKEMVPEPPSVCEDVWILIWGGVRGEWSAAWACRGGQGGWRAAGEGL
jgi:hypothetical protein